MQTNRNESENHSENDEQESNHENEPLTEKELNELLNLKPPVYFRGRMSPYINGSLDHIIRNQNLYLSLYFPTDEWIDEKMFEEKLKEIYNDLKSA